MLLTPWCYSTAHRVVMVIDRFDFRMLAVVGVRNEWSSLITVWVPIGNHLLQWAEAGWTDEK